jgi:cell division ATPase FtsA
MRIFKKDLGNKNLIVLDIGSQFLKALLLEIDKEEERGILQSWTREKIVDDLKELYSVCQKAINKIEEKTGVRAGEIFLGVSGKIIKGTSTDFCYRRENPKQKIDLAELKYLVQKVQWKAFDKIRKIFALETGLSEAKVKLVNAHIINIKIDNNTVANPLGFQGENLCLSVFNSYTSVEWLETLAELSSRLGLKWLGVNSSSYALFHSLDLESLSNEDSLIIDIGGKITDATLVKGKGDTVEIKSFNLGGELFTRTISDFLELGADEAETIKVKYSKGEVSSEARKKLGKLLSPDISSWLGGIKVILDEFSKKYKSSPRRVFLCGGGSNLPGIKEVIEKKGSFDINFILPREFIKIKNKTKFQDIPSLALAVLALESPEATEFSFTLKRIMRLIQE